MLLGEAKADETGCVNYVSSMQLDDQHNSEAVAKQDEDNGMAPNTCQVATACHIKDSQRLEGTMMTSDVACWDPEDQSQWYSHLSSHRAYSKLFTRSSE